MEEEARMDGRSRDDELMRGFLLSLHAVTLALQVGNLMSSEEYWRVVTRLLNTLQYFTQENYQLTEAILPVPPDAFIPEALSDAWGEQFAHDREAAVRVLTMLGLPAKPRR
jgi:hypothetical protein